MFPLFAIIFLVVPVIEIYFLIQVGESIGALWTVILVVLTAVIGVRLLKQQGLSTLMKAQNKMRSGSLPATEIAEGVALIVAGALLLTPGFFTDTIGFLLLIPLTRHLTVVLFASKIVEHLKRKSSASSGYGNFYEGRAYREPSEPHSVKKGELIENVKYKEEKDHSSQ